MFYESFYKISIIPYLRAKLHLFTHTAKALKHKIMHSKSFFG